MIGSFFTSNPDAVKAAQSGSVEYELLPQGTLAEANSRRWCRHCRFLHADICRNNYLKRKRTKKF
jgi:hypothetical protein